MINEEEIQIYWDDEQIFKKSINQENPIFTFYDGPPFATGLPHYGHILAGFIKDAIGRYQTQNSMSVPRRAGWDTHGLPIEYEIDKQYGINTIEQIKEWGISNYNSACREIVMRYSNDWESIMNRLGRWVDFKDDYKTLDFDYMNEVWKVFFQLGIKGLIYSSYRVMPYSVACKTPLSNFETQQNYQDIEDKTLIVKFKMTNNKDLLYQEDIYFLVWTTTPWTLPSNIAIAVNPIMKYSLVYSENVYYIIATNLINKVFAKKEYSILPGEYTGLELTKYKYIPLFNSYPIDKLNDKLFSIIAADFVTDSDGTGLVHIAPSYGEDDYNVCIKNGIISNKELLFMSINEEGFFTDINDLEELSGIFYKPQGNNIIIKKLKSLNYTFSETIYKHSYPFCWRSDTPLMYRAIKSWFVNVEVLKDRMVELNKTINWIPSNIGSGRFHNWLSSAKDWCIARSRYWGTPIPIWKNILDDTDYIIINSAEELEKLTGLEPSTLFDLHRDKIDHLTFIKDGKTYKRIDEVFDCWFESGAMPYASKQTKFPADFIAEGIDQTRGWFYTLLVLSTALHDSVPFKNVIVNGLILAQDGKKMSKRLKNYPDPMDVVNKYGSDALRLYLLGSNATKGDVLKFNENGVKDILKDIIIPLKNSLSFYLEYEYKYNLENSDKTLYTNQDYTTNNILDMYAIKYIGNLISGINIDLNNYLLSEACKKIGYIIEILNNVYIKFNRCALKGRNPNWKSSLSTLGLILKYLAINIAPLMPFFAEYLFQKLTKSKESVHLTKFSNIEYHLPTLNIEQDKMADNMTHILNIIKQVFTIRSKNNISMKIPIGNLIIKTSDSLLELIKEHSNFIIDELNILDIEISSFEWTNTDIEIVPNYIMIKQKYSNTVEIKHKIDIINKDKYLKQYLVQNKNILLDGILIEYNMVDIIIKPKTIPNYVSQYSFIDGYNYCVYINTEQTLQIKELAYGKLIATLFQRMRKNAGLHTWDPINIGLYGDTDYDFEKISSIIEKTCLIKPNKLTTTLNEYVYIYKMSEYTEDLTNNLILFLY